MQITILIGTKPEVSRLNLGEIIQTLSINIMLMTDDLTHKFIRSTIQSQAENETGHALILATDETVTYNCLKDFQTDFPEIRNVISAQSLLPRPVLFKNWMAERVDRQRLFEFEKRMSDTLAEEVKLPVARLPSFGSAIPRQQGKSWLAAQELEKLDQFYKTQDKLFHVDKVWFEEAGSVSQKDFDAIALSMEPPFTKKINALREFLDSKFPGWKTSYFKGAGAFERELVIDSGFSAFNVAIPSDVIKQVYPNMSKDEILADIQRAMKLIDKGDTC